jgi:hypothetical protein
MALRLVRIRDNGPLPRNRPLLRNGFGAHVFPCQRISRLQQTNRSKGCSISGPHQAIKGSSFGSSVSRRREVVIESSRTGVVKVS